MFRVLAPVIINPTNEARSALGAQLRAASLAVWREICRRRQGLEYAHFQTIHTGVTLAVSSRVRPNGYIEITIGLGDPRQAARVITETSLRRAEAGVRHRNV